MEVLIVLWEQGTEIEVHGHQVIQAIRDQDYRLKGSEEEEG